MKNCIKIFGIIALIAIIGFSMTACGDGGGGGGGGLDLTVGNTDGRLTINNIIPEHNGKWIIAFGGYDQDNGLFAAASLSSSGTVTGGLISGGSVTLNVWLPINDTTLGNFNGSGMEEFMLFVMNKTSISVDEMESVFGEHGDEPDWLLDMGMGEVTFSAGIGTMTNLMWFSEFDFD
ncbi:MAG: hypothetical protein FWD40_03990 [Treponema sp.]|nr:hypothetical protein [Treponema sp.]